MATTTSSTGQVDGIISGLNTTDILNQLAAIKQQPITALQTQVTQLQDNLTAYKSLDAQILAMQTSADALTDDTTFNGRAATCSDTSLLIVSADSGASMGSYGVSVKALAVAQKIASGSVADSTTALNQTGSFLINGKTIALAASDTLSALSGKINQSGAGVTASIIKVSSTQSQLVLTAGSAGASNAIDAVDADGSGILESLGILNGVTSAKHATTDGVAGDYLSSGTANVGATLELSDAPSGTVKINGQDVAIDLATDSLSTIAGRINAAGAGVTASVTADTSSGSTQYRLELSGDGASSMTDDNHVLETLGLVSQGVADQRTAAQDAHIVIDGSDVYRSTNDISDVVDGVTFHLLQADENTTAQVSVAADADSTVNAVQSFVTAFNNVMDTIDNGEKFDTDTNTGGTFFGDPTIQLLQDRLHDAAMNPVTGATGGYTLMSQIGISTDTSDHLTLDTARLQAALEANPDAVARLFATHGQATSSEVSFVSAAGSTVASGATGYAVNVTQAAAKATATSAHLPGGITQDETLTINGNCIVSLTAGQTLEQARDAINTILLGNSQDVTASIQGDQLQLIDRLYGSSKTFSVRSSLAAGAGGTDLGASAANQTRIYAGLDVQGAINGEACDGYGQYLTGSAADANVAGLKLLIASATTGDKGYVQVGKGAGSRVDDFAAQANDTKGTMTSAENAVQADIDAANDEITKMNDDVAQYISDMRDKFTAMEEVMGQQKTISDYMTGQITALTKTSTSNSS